MKYFKGLYQRVAVSWENGLCFYGCRCYGSFSKLRLDGDYKMYRTADKPSNPALGAPTVSLLALLKYDYLAS